MTAVHIILISMVVFFISIKIIILSYKKQWHSLKINIIIIISILISLTLIDNFKDDAHNEILTSFESLCNK